MPTNRAPRDDDSRHPVSTPFRIFVAATAAVLTLASVGRADFNSDRRGLANVYIHENDVVRVFYDRTGPNAVNAADRNANNVPDVVEDVGKQSWAAYRLFTDTLHFQDPLKSPRYQQAKYIDINLLASATFGGGNGVAYDGLITFNRPIDPAGTRVITIDIATSVDPTANATPTHEMFHLVQNGYTFFKTRWYTEGMARWSEHITDAGGIGPISYPAAGPWPQSQAVLDDLFSRTYAAESILWNPLAQLDNPGGVVPEADISSAIAGLRYTANNAPVLEDRQLVGAEMIRQMLEELAVMDDKAYAALGYTSWTEDNQKSLANSPFIYQSILDVARRRGHDIGAYSAINTPEPASVSFVAAGLACGAVRRRR